MAAGRLVGKVALVTGTGGGQGRAAALLFAREGARVVGCDIQVAGAEATVRLVREAGGEMSSTHPVDLGDPAQATAWVESAGRIDVVYNNAAAARGASIAKLSDDDWRFTIRNAVDLVFNVCRAAWPSLVARGGGSIVNTSSTAGLGGSHTASAAYAAAKGAVIAMTRQLATEGGPVGIRVNCIAPGTIATGNATALATDPEYLRSYVPQTPLGRFGIADDIAYAALYLACEESAFVTGQTLVVDGGRMSTGFVYFPDS